MLLLTNYRKGSDAPPSTLLIPSILVGLAMLLPLVYLIIRSSGATDEVWKLLFRPSTAYTFFRTAALVATVTLTSVGIALPLAWLTVRTDIPFRKMWSILTALPLVIPSFLGAYLFVSMFGPKGLLQQSLSGTFGIERLPEIYGLPGATLVLALLSYPYVLLTVRGTLQNLDPSSEESARTLGHNIWSTTLYITLPQLRPAIVSGVLLVALYSLSDFGAVSMMKYPTFTWVIFEQYETAFDRSIASVFSLILVGLAVTILWLEGRMRGRMRYYRTGTGVARPQNIVQLKYWKWPAMGLCLLVVLFSLGLPTAILIQWLVRGIVSGSDLILSWSTAWNSFYVSGLAALTAAIFSIPLAILVVRYPSRLSRSLERVSFTGYALPGIVVALALVFFGATYASPLYQTIWLLIFAYVILYFPAAMGATRSSVLQINPTILEGALSLGANPNKITREIVGPLIIPGVIMGAGLVFLITVKELPATLILGPIGFKTLSTTIWSASSEAFFAQAAAPALVLILISSIPMAFLVFRKPTLDSGHQNINLR